MRQGRLPMGELEASVMDVLWTRGGWLTPGEVEGSASMWQDSVATEGWALYAEQLMAEPAREAPQGFYTPEERGERLFLLKKGRVQVYEVDSEGREFTLSVADRTLYVSLGDETLTGVIERRSLVPGA